MTFFLTLEKVSVRMKWMIRWRLWKHFRDSLDSPGRCLKIVRKESIKWALAHKRRSQSHLTKVPLSGSGIDSPWREITQPNFLHSPFLNVIMKRWRKLSCCSWFCVRAHLPNCFLHTHTPQSAAGLVGLVVVVGLLKKVMCTYRNLGIFTSPFRPL